MNDARALIGRTGQGDAESIQDESSRQLDDLFGNIPVACPRDKVGNFLRQSHPTVSFRIAADVRLWRNMAQAYDRVQEEISASNGRDRLQSADFGENFTS